MITGASSSKPEVDKAKEQVFQITAEEAKEMPDVVSGTFIVNNVPANVLFDSGANRSFVSARFCMHLGCLPRKLDENLEVETADGTMTLVSEVFDGCTIDIDGYKFKIQLLPIVISGFDIVVGMDWLFKHQAQIVCNKKMIRINTSEGNEIVVYGSRKKSQPTLISSMKARKCIRKGCQVYLAYVIDAKKEKRSLCMVAERKFNRL